MLPAVTQEIQKRGYAFVPRQNISIGSDSQLGLEDLRDEYAMLPEDGHLNTGEGERFRRYARLAIVPKTFEIGVYPHTKFFQSKKFDDLYGDIYREFAPATQSILNNAFFLDLIRDDFRQFPLPPDNQNELWEVSVHIIKIAATQSSNIGRPAPEGIHQDGYHFGAVHLMQRENLEGAESRVYDLKKTQIDSACLKSPMDSVLMDDRKIFHGVQPFKALDPTRPAYRDILILLFQPSSESPQPTAIPRF